MHKTSPIPDDTPNIGTIRSNTLLLFKQSTGWWLRVKGTGNPGLIDKIVRVDEANNWVVGEKDSYHVDWCEIYSSPKNATGIPDEHLGFLLTSDFE